MRVLQVAAAHDSGMILNRIGADGQVYGGVVMGIGQALTEGTQLDDDGRQRNAAPARLQARHRRGRAADRHRWVETDTPNAGPKGVKGVGEPPCVPTAGAVANAIAKVIGRPRARAADDARARLGGDARERERVRHARRTRRRGASTRSPRGARPVAGGTDLVVGARSGQGARCPRASSRSTASTSCAGSTCSTTAACGSARSRRHAEIAANPVVRERLHRARRRLRDRRLARDPRAGHDRRQPHERVAGDGDRRAARLPRRDGDAPLAGGDPREVPVDELFDRPGQTTRRAGELLAAVDVPAPPAGTGSATCGSSTAARWRSRSSAPPPS